jgi:putative sensory transduction regulator
MNSDPGAPEVHAADVERWLADLGLEPVERAERDGIASWDLVLDGRRRFDLRVTVILDPSLALICWAHFAPPINDMFRKSYKKLLRWNDEFPFAKFSVGEDERPLLAVELPIDGLAAVAAGPAAGGAGADTLGLALARIVGIADRLLDESKAWLWIGGRMPDQGDRTSRNLALLDRFQGRLPDIFEAAVATTEDEVAPAADSAEDPSSSEVPA